VADVLVEVGVGARGGRGRREREQCLGLLLAPLARTHRIHGEDPVRGLLRPDHRHSEIARVAGDEHLVRLPDSWIDGDIRDRPRRTRLDDVADEPRRRRSPGVESVVPARPGDRAHHHLVALQHPDRGTVGPEQLHGVAHRCVEDVVRIELARELAAGLGEPLRQMAGATFALVERAALERTPRGRRDLRRELELFVVERALALEENEHEPSPFAPGLLEWNGQQRVPTGSRRRGPEAVAEAIVVAETPGRQHLAAAGTRRQRRGALAEVRREPFR
jgi:hypothetical protein